MTQMEIAKAAKDISVQLNMNDEERRELQGERLKIQHICQHPNMRQVEPYHHQCPDCLLNRWDGP